MEYQTTSTVFGERARQDSGDRRTSRWSATPSRRPARSRPCSRCLTLEHQRIPPTINYEIPDPDDPVRRRRQQGARCPRHRRDVELVRLRRPERFADPDARTGLTGCALDHEPLLLRTKSPISRRRQAARRSRRRRVDDRPVAHHALFRSRQDRELCSAASRAGSAAALREQRIGRANLDGRISRRNHPRRSRRSSPASGTISAAVGAEFAHIDHIWDYNDDNPDPQARIEIPPAYPLPVSPSRDWTANRR